MLWQIEIHNLNLNWRLSWKAENIKFLKIQVKVLSFKRLKDKDVPCRKKVIFLKILLFLDAACENSRPHDINCPTPFKAKKIHFTPMASSVNIPSPKVRVGPTSHSQYPNLHLGIRYFYFLFFQNFHFSHFF